MTLQCLEECDILIDGYCQINDIPLHLDMNVDEKENI